jgi:hypothetical protein
MSDPMTPEAKAAVMQLMGQTYGQMKKQDDMIVGASAQLQAKSNEMKNMVEQLVATPTVASSQQPPQPAPAPQAPAPQPQAAPAPVAPAPVTPEQAQLELQAAAPVAPAPVAPAPVVEEQLGLDFSEPSQMDQLLAAVKESNLLLKDIKLQLESTNVKPTRKKAKSKVA